MRWLFIGSDNVNQGEQYAQATRMPTRTSLRQPPWTDVNLQPQRGLL